MRWIVDALSFVAEFADKPVATEIAIVVPRLRQADELFHVLAALPGAGRYKPMVIVGMCRVSVRCAEARPTWAAGRIFAAALVCPTGRATFNEIQARTTTPVRTFEVTP